MKTLLIVLFFFVIHNGAIQAQNPEGRSSKIDSIFQEWNKINHPGGVVGVQKEGEIIFLKAYGSASLEYNVDNTISTIFNLGSLSKQFTAMGILILEEQGKLSIDDNIKKYLPEIPYKDENITIRQMLHHTSGLRSFHALLELAGWRSNDVRTNDDLKRLILKQKDLNFTPGEEFLYSNTGYMLLADIIERVTEENFEEWMKKNVFLPLGLSQTFITRKSNASLPNTATSYIANENGFERAVEIWNYVGSGNVYTTTEDFMKWLQNYGNVSPNWPELFGKMLTVDSLTNGDLNNYAFGVVVDDFKGRKRLHHSGIVGGFQSYFVSIPEENLHISVFSNFSSSSVGNKAIEIADILVKENKKQEEEISVNIKSTFEKPVFLDQSQLNQYEGSYWSEKNSRARYVKMKGDTLIYSTPEGMSRTLVPLGENLFKMNGVNADVVLKFTPVKEGNQKMTIMVNGNPQEDLELFDSTLPSNEEIKDYIGTYYSPELETSYKLLHARDKKDVLEFYHARHGYLQAKILRKDVLEGQWPLKIIKFKRGPKGNIVGARVNNGRVQNLWFEKQEIK